MDMDFHVLMAIFAGALTVASVVPYVRDMLKGSTRPNVVSWGIWCLVQAIFAAAQVAEGASLSIVLPIAEVLTVGVVVVLGLAGYGYKKYGRLDFICLGLALGAIVLWQLTDEPMVAMCMAVVADLLAAIPTLVKAYKDSKSETPSAYFLVALSALAAGFATSIIDLPNLLWPAYIFALNSSILSLILLGKRVKKSSK
jgi:hypothetical protein